MKVFIGVGHGGSDPGAVSYLVEKDVNLVEALACRDFLEAHGVQVLMSRTSDEDDPLTDEIKECNAFNPDLAVDIHNNAGGGDGFEAYYHYNGGTGKTLAQNIESEKFPNMVICLMGDLGSGKTVFTKGFAQALEVKEEVTSPTFTIIKEYTSGLSGS